MKSLVAYFSHAGENYGVSDTKVGNGKHIADYLTELTGSDEFEIKASKEYPFGYDDCCDVAKLEKNNHERPELVNYLDNLDHYATIYLVYPMWWGTCPMAVFTFLEHNSFKDKKIYLFSTHEGSGFGTSITDVQKTITNAQIEAGLDIYGHDAINSKEVIEKWLKTHENR